VYWFQTLIIPFCLFPDLTAALEEIKSKPIHVPIKPEDFDPELKKEEGEPSVATTTSNLDPLSFAHALITAPPEGTIVFFQMPDQLPVLDSTPVSDSGVEVREAKLSSSIGVLPEGYIGKMQIFASGATRLVLGENAFDILPAKPVSFRQVSLKFAPYTSHFPYFRTFLKLLLIHHYFAFCLIIEGIGGNWLAGQENDRLRTNQTQIPVYSGFRTTFSTGSLTSANLLSHIRGLQLFNSEFSRFDKRPRRGLDVCGSFSLLIKFITPELFYFDYKRHVRGKMMNYDSTP